MRIFNRAHVPWFFFVVVATLISVWLYVGNFVPEKLPAGLRLPPQLVQKASTHRSVGGTPVGLMFGAISLAIFVFAAFLGLRKKVVLWRVGTVQQWLRAHIWLSLLTIPLVILHSGFRFGGPMTTLLMVLYAIVMVSGIYGLALQHQLPRIMKERLPTETVFEQIPYIRAQLHAAAAKMRDSIKAATLAQTAVAVADRESAPAVDTASETAFLDFLDQQVLPYLAARRGDKFRLNDTHYSEDLFRFVKLRVADEYRDRVEEIQAWCDQRRVLDLQTRLQHWLHGWLFVHVPISFLLIMLTAWHAYATLFYY